MSHVSLYRKYRPQRFDEVLGQDHVTTTLKRAIAEDRLVHAYLFSGPRGTGKTSTARILAKALNCERGPAPEPCNECEACRQITQGVFLDVAEYDAASHGSVDDAREIREKVAYAPTSGRHKLYIVDECHMLSTAANNALLKVLEEPPARVVFVFVTTDPHKVLKTLLDRCQRYDFRALGTEDVAEGIRRVSEMESLEIEQDALSLLASRARGSLRDGQSLLDQIASYSPGRVTTADVLALLGDVPEDLFFETADLIADRDAAAVLTFTDRLVRSGRDVREFAAGMLDHLRKLLLVSHTPSAGEILEAPDEQMTRLASQANRLGGGELLHALDLLASATAEMRQAPDPRISLELALVRAARPDLHATPPSLLARIERLERMAGLDPHSPAGAPPEATPTAAPAGKARSPGQKERPPRKRVQPAEPAPPPEDAEEPGPPSAPTSPIDLEMIKARWPAVLQGVKRRKASLHALLLPASPARFEEGELVLAFGPRSRYHHDQVADPGRQAPLLETLFETFGIRPKIRCSLTDEENQPPPVPTEAAEPGDPIDLVRTSFGAEVVEER